MKQDGRKRCTVCGHRDEILHSGRPLLEVVYQDVWVQRHLSGWIVCKAGGLLCMDHPKLHISVRPKVAMTPANPRWGEFTESLNARLEKIGCKSGRDKTQAAAVLKEMGMGLELINPSFAYFESHGGFCDCEIIYNIAMAGR